jgi:hypothetical protein
MTDPAATSRVLGAAGALRPQRRDAEVTSVTGPWESLSCLMRTVVELVESDSSRVN